MKRGLSFLLVMSLVIAPFSIGCESHEKDNKHKASVEVDTKGSDKGVKVETK